MGSNWFCPDWGRCIQPNQCDKGKPCPKKRKDD